MSARESGLTSPSAEENFVLRMRVLREARGLSQAEVAARLAREGLALPQQTIARIETGKRSLRLDEAQAIARALGSDLAQMTSRIVEITDADRQYEEAQKRRAELGRELGEVQARLEQATLHQTALRHEADRLEAAYAEAEAAAHALWEATTEGKEVLADDAEALKQNWDEIAARVDSMDEETNEA